VKAWLGKRKGRKSRGDGTADATLSWGRRTWTRVRNQVRRSMTLRAVHWSEAVRTDKSLTCHTCQPPSITTCVSVPIVPP
jgi:hypothetical protein